MEGLKCHRQQFQGASSWRQWIGLWTPVLKISGWASDFLSCFSLVPSFVFILGSLEGGKIQTSFEPRSGPSVMPCRFAGQCIELLTDLQPTQLVYRLFQGFVEARYVSHFLSLEITLFGWPTAPTFLSFWGSPALRLCQGKDPAIGAYATTDVVGRPGVSKGAAGKLSEKNIAQL